jgi:hypothetical protein
MPEIEISQRVCRKEAQLYIRSQRPLKRIRKRRRIDFPWVLAA